MKTTCLYQCDGTNAVRHISYNEHDTLCGLRASNPDDAENPILCNEHDLDVESDCAECARRAS